MKETLRVLNSEPTWPLFHGRHAYAINALMASHRGDSSRGDEALHKGPAWLHRVGFDGYRNTIDARRISLM